jgi:hypothetical protein
VNGFPRLLFMIVNDKGGVGKSTVTALISDWHHARGRNPRLFDTDKINRTLQRYYPEAELLDTNEITNIDLVVEALAEERLVILDNKGGGMEDADRGFLKWLEDVELLDWAGDRDIGLTFGAVVNHIPENNEGIGRTMETIGDRVNWVVFRNFLDFKDSRIWDRSPIRERAIALGAYGIEVPRIADSLIAEMHAQSLPLSQLKLANWAADGRLKQTMRKFYNSLDKIEDVLTVNDLSE